MDAEVVLCLQPVLMMDDAAAAEEINQLADGNSPGANPLPIS